MKSNKSFIFLIMLSYLIVEISSTMTKLKTRTHTHTHTNTHSNMYIKSNSKINLKLNTKTKTKSLTENTSNAQSQGLTDLISYFFNNANNGISNQSQNYFDNVKRNQNKNQLSYKSSSNFNFNTNLQKRRFTKSSKNIEDYFDSSIFLQKREDNNNIKPRININNIDINTNNQIQNDQNDLNPQLLHTNSLWNSEHQQSDFTILKSGWLRINSKKFSASGDFPPVYLPDGSQLQILVDSNNFLKNPGFRSIQSLKSNSTLLNTINDNYFYFRLSHLNLYFTINSKEKYILSSLSINSISNIEAFNDYAEDGLCFQIFDQEKKDWKLCAYNIEEKNLWICEIEKLLNKHSPRCPSKEIDHKVKEIEVTVNKPLIIIPYPSRHCNEKWDYSHNGDDWECECSEGKEQSPIDLPSTKDAISTLIRPMFQYNHITAKSTETSPDLDKTNNQGENLKIIYKENLIRILHPNFGRAVSFDGTIYQAEEIQFHTPSEHTIDGKRFSMEMQVLHYGLTKGDIGKQFILSILFEAQAGVYNQFINDLDFFNLPNNRYRESDIVNNLFIPKVFYNTDEDIKSEDIKYLKPFSFYTYQGSLTSPPCAENTIVIVAADVQRMSYTALNMFKEAVKPKIYQDGEGNITIDEEDAWANYRKTQDRNGRPVFYFDCGKYCPKMVREEVNKPQGHYEKVERKAKEYFYVTDNEPSGLPSAFVVGKDEAESKFPPIY
jgi:carbonic anhydrase